MQIVFTIGGTVLVWVATLGFLFFTRHFSREAAVAIHYLWSGIAFGFLAFALRKASVQYSAVVLSFTVTGTLLSLSLFYWVFVNPIAADRYLTVADWLFPALITAVVTYIVSRLTQCQNS